MQRVDQIDHATGDVERSGIMTEILVLEDRLARGWAMIENSESSGSNVDDLYAHFLQLLRQYETLYDRRNAA